MLVATGDDHESVEGSAWFATLAAGVMPSTSLRVYRDTAG